MNGAKATRSGKIQLNIFEEDNLGVNDTNQKALGSAYNVQVQHVSIINSFIFSLFFILSLQESHKGTDSMKCDGQKQSGFKGNMIQLQQV